MKLSRRFAVFGETFSPNLGDGVIADSIAFLIKRIDPSAMVELVDLSNRSGFLSTPVATSVRVPGLRARLLQRSRMARRGAAFLKWQLRLRSVSRAAWRARIHAVDACIIGGGQILADRDFGFPPKIREVVRCSRVLGKPVGFFACGVDQTWSILARRFYADSMLGSEVRWVSVRDSESSRSLARHLPMLEGKITLTYDPALWASEVYSISGGSGASVGLGLQHPLGLARNDNIYANAGPEAVERFWCEIATTLREAGRKVVLFTNGAPEDYGFAERVARRLGAEETGGGVTLLERPVSPAQLVGQLSECRVIVANRLHANIIATSLGIPAVGLGWDSKMINFFQETGREEFCVTSADKLIPERVLAVVSAAEGVGVNATILEMRKKAILDAMGGMLDELF